MNCSFEWNGFLSSVCGEFIKLMAVKVISFVLVWINAQCSCVFCCGSDGMVVNDKKCGIVFNESCYNLLNEWKMLCVVVIGQNETICWIKDLHFSFLAESDECRDGVCMCVCSLDGIEFAHPTNNDTLLSSFIINKRETMRQVKEYMFVVSSSAETRGTSKAWNYFKATRIFLIH